MFKKKLLIFLFVFNVPTLAMETFDTSDVVDADSFYNGNSSNESGEMEGEIEGQSNIPEDLLKNFGEIKVKDCFFRAVETNNLALAEFCLKNRIGEINSRNNEDQTALMLAVQKINLELVILFVTNGASVHLVDSKGNNSLHYFIFFWHLEPKKRTALVKQWIVEPKMEQIIELLIKYGVSINSCDYEGNTLLFKALKYKVANWVIDLLCKFKPDCSFVNKSRESCWNYATPEQKLILRKLIKSAQGRLVEEPATIPDKRSKCIIL